MESPTASGEKSSSGLVDVDSNPFGAREVGSQPGAQTSGRVGYRNLDSISLNIRLVGRNRWRDDGFIFLCTQHESPLSSKGAH